MVAAHLIGGPRDGDTLTAARHESALQVPSPYEPDGPLVTRHDLYRRERAATYGPHPCIRGLAVHVEWFAYVHSSMPTESIPLAAVTSRGADECEIVPDERALNAEQRAVREALWATPGPGQRWASQLRGRPSRRR